MSNEIRSKGIKEKHTEDTNPLDGTRPLSLQMGPTVIWLNALGDIDARAIVDAWAPRFNITTVATLEESTWQ
jgi:hypothetical protein